MPDWFVALLVPALGFLLGFFYTRTMRAADSMPEKYMTKSDCLQCRRDCQRMRDMTREDIFQRLDKFDEKLDRLFELLMGWANGKS
ncbi:MAG TPA: hypothetical protein VGK71_08460 [Nitrospirota bacterium]